MSNSKSKKPTTTKPSSRLKNTSTAHPIWIETVSHQNHLLNEKSYFVGAAEGAKCFSSLAKTFPVKIDGCISGITTLEKHMLNIAKYNPISHSKTYSRLLSSSLESLSRYTPLIGGALNIPQLGVLEQETAKLIKTAKILTTMPLSSLQLTETLKPIMSLAPELRIKADKLLSTSHILKSYSSFVTQQHKRIHKDLESTQKRFKMIELATELMQDHITTTCDYLTDENQQDDYNANTEPQLKTTKNAIQYLPSYLGYTLKDSSNCDLEEEFQKSMICKILQGGKDIISKIEYINDLYLRKGEKVLFTPTNKTFKAVSCLSTAFSVDDITFGNVIDSLYMLLYEGSGEAKRITSLLEKEECTTLWNIKHIRTDFRHDIEHGDEKKYLQKSKSIGDAYKAICGKSKPLKQKDWVTAQCNIYTQVNDFLDLMIEKIVV